MSNLSVTANIAKLLQRVRLAAQKSQRSNTDIRILAVSKTQSIRAIREACDSGLREFGENYLQEAVEKILQLDDLDLTWHFIGPIQTNKTRLIAQHFSWVHSVDRLKVARRLNDQRPPELPPMQVCIQVNTSGEASKSGVSLEMLSELAGEINKLPRLNLRGLMAIPAATNDPQEQRRAFATLRRALEDLKAIAPNLDTLSMGMSGDMEAAIDEGSTLVRIGTGIFGPRNT
ncbi:MAG: YggS family pyridoxal phosphate-dependent enzyme [Halioglobus sp.]